MGQTQIHTLTCGSISVLTSRPQGCSTALNEGKEKFGKLGTVHSATKIPTTTEEIHRDVDPAAHILCQACVNARGAYQALMVLHTSSSINQFIILRWCHGFGQEFSFVSAEVRDSPNWKSRSNIASYERRVRGAASTPIALPCPFRTST